MMSLRLLRSKPVVIALLSAAALVALPSTPAHAGKHPVPNVYPLPGVWYFNFRHALPKRIVVAVPGDKVPTAYWYMTYTVTNNSGKEQDFLPEFEMVTQDGKTHLSDRNIPLAVFQTIKKTEGNDLLQTAATATGPLHQGEDQAKDIVAIWPEPMARMGAFSIYVGALNGEYVRMKTEDGKPMLDATGSQIVLRKTLELNYIVYGDEVKPDRDEVHDRAERWIMR